MFSVARSFMAVAAPVGLLGLHFVVMMCYINRWDHFVTITLIPIWIWAIFGISLSLFSLLFLKGKLAILSLLIWLGTGLICADETPALMREVKDSYLRNKSTTKQDRGAKSDDPSHLRVITLNCSERNFDAAEELKSLNPDIIFLQECPPIPQLRQLAQHFFDEEGSYVSSWQCAIIARGKLSQIGTEPLSSSVYATLKTPDGKEFDLINLHLQQSVPRFDIWNPNRWKTQVIIRRENRSQLIAIVEMFPKRAASWPRIIGGDFGTPPGDAIFRVLDPNFDDSFKAAGHGWSNTYSHHFPIVRTDQLWASPDLVPITGIVLPSNHSDHRIVVCDYQIAGPEGLLTRTHSSNIYLANSFFTAPIKTSSTSGATSDAR